MTQLKNYLLMTCLPFYTLGLKHLLIRNTLIARYLFKDNNKVATLLERKHFLFTFPIAVTDRNQNTAQSFNLAPADPAAHDPVHDMRTEECL